MSAFQCRPPFTYRTWYYFPIHRFTAKTSLGNYWENPHYTKWSTANFSWVWQPKFKLSSRDRAERERCEAQSNTEPEFALSNNRQDLYRLVELVWTTKVENLHSKENLTKKGVVRILAIFQHGGLCSATSINSSRRDLLNDMAEHIPILKNNQNTHHPRVGFTLRIGSLPQNGAFVLTV